MMWEMQLRWVLVKLMGDDVGMACIVTKRTVLQYPCSRSDDTKQALSAHDLETLLFFSSGPLA